MSLASNRITNNYGEKMKKLFFVLSLFLYSFSSLAMEKFIECFDHEIKVSFDLNNPIEKLQHYLTNKFMDRSPCKEESHIFSHEEDTYQVRMEIRNDVSTLVIYKMKKSSSRFEEFFSFASPREGCFLKKKMEISKANAARAFQVIEKSGIFPDMKGQCPILGILG